VGQWRRWKGNTAFRPIPQCTQQAKIWGGGIDIIVFPPLYISGGPPVLSPSQWDRRQWAFLTPRTRLCPTCVIMRNLSAACQWSMVLAYVQRDQPGKCIPSRPAVPFKATRCHRNCHRIALSIYDFLLVNHRLISYFFRYKVKFCSNRFFFNFFFYHTCI